MDQEFKGCVMDRFGMNRRFRVRGTSDRVFLNGVGEDHPDLERRGKGFERIGKPMWKETHRCFGRTETSS